MSNERIDRLVNECATQDWTDERVAALRPFIEGLGFKERAELWNGIAAQYQHGREKNVKLLHKHFGFLFLETFTSVSAELDRAEKIYKENLHVPEAFDEARSDYVGKTFALRCGKTEFLHVAMGDSEETASHVLAAVYQDFSEGDEFTYLGDFDVKAKDTTGEWLSHRLPLCEHELTGKRVIMEPWSTEHAAVRWLDG